MKKKLNVCDGLLFIIPLALLLAYIAGAFGDTGMMPLDWRISNAIFWGSILVFLVGAYNITGKIDRPPPGVKEYNGTITRVLGKRGSPEEHLISGSPSETIRGVVVKNWPFEDRASDSHWYVLNSEGNDVTEEHFDSIEGAL